MAEAGSVSCMHTLFFCVGTIYYGPQLHFGKKKRNKEKRKIKKEKKKRKKEKKKRKKRRRRRSRLMRERKMKKRRRRRGREGRKEKESWHAACDATFVSKKLLRSTGKAAWIAGTTFLILFVPLIIEMDREQQFNELELQQASLLGAPPTGPPHK
ncbi:hypothetical protein PVK06_024138 [Gossypium arboreum]|uniref:Mitochondrial import receptor subunit TOM22 homolog n=1 Tax=Gossypium arboreum TaxID=29729 RepID=A0ABR0PD06_GOSAR|nr:hypothetical protein PVK06_024138 [Gossypium arboreum]